MIPPTVGGIEVTAARGPACLVVLVVALLASGTPARAAATAEVPRATGQVDRATPVRGKLRDELLAASVRGRRSAHPDPAHPILIRSALSVGGTRVLLVAFRSLAGKRCSA